MNLEKFLKENRPLPPAPSVYEEQRIKACIDAEEREKGSAGWRWMIPGFASFAIIALIFFADVGNHPQSLAHSLATVQAEPDTFLWQTTEDPEEAEETGSEWLALLDTVAKK